MDYIEEIEHFEFVICVERYIPGRGCPFTSDSDVDCLDIIEYVVKCDGEIVEVTPDLDYAYTQLIKKYFDDARSEAMMDLYEYD